jgi:anti-sigma regulatory factor (Ser/Thr protein kinase)
MNPINQNSHELWQEKHLLISGFDYETKKDTNQKIRMQILSDPKFLKPFRNFVYDISISYGISPRVSFDIKIMANESFTNIIKHSYENYPYGWIFFEYLFYSTYIELRFRDFGKKKFNPKELIPKDLSDFRDKGLGLYIISKLSDYHYFKHLENLGTLLVIKKRI